MRIQHNIAALNSHRQLTNNNSSVSKNLEKLSSGYRINRAGDDAAGLAISEKMRAQITGLNTASKNAQDGISLVQTAEGALTEVHSMLNRMAELADQSANGTYQDAVDRENIQKELNSLRSEVDRISQGTNFNGIKLLDGSMGGGGDTTTVTIAGAAITGLGSKVKEVKIAFTTAGAGTGDASVTGTTIDADGVLTINVTGASAGGATTIAAADLEAALKAAGYADAKVTGNTTAITADVAATKNTTVKATASTIAGTRGNGFAISFGKGVTDITSIQLTAVDATGNAVGVTNNNGAIAITLDDSKSYTAADINKMLKEAGSNATVKFDGSKASTDIQAGLGLATAQNVTSGVGKAGGGLTLQIGESSDDFNQLNVSVGSMSTSSLGIDAIDVGTQDGAKAAIDLIKSAINSVSSTRGDLGAIQNRLEHTINNLGVTSENMSAAESRIRDVDMAQEMMNFTKNNILTQASQAMLAQANQLPQGVLQLLQ